MYFALFPLYNASVVYLSDFVYSLSKRVFIHLAKMRELILFYIRRLDTFSLTAAFFNK
jgi:hypothetical protein